MKQFRCDICKAETNSEYDLTTLYESYQSKDIKHVCGDCNQELTECNVAMIEAVNHLKSSWMKKLIKKMLK